VMNITFKCLPNSNAWNKRTVNQNYGDVIPLQTFGREPYIRQHTEVK
jgi:hypothetical protein